MKAKDLDKDIIKIVKSTTLEKAPVGMIDRIMANVAVQTIRKLSVKPVKVHTFWAWSVLILTITLLLAAFFIQPDSSIYFNWLNKMSPRVEFNVNAFWLIPVCAISGAIWLFILYESRNSRIHNH